MKSKLKTKKSLSKRVKITKRGKIKRKKMGMSHLLSGKTRTKKRSLKKSTTVNNTQKKMINKCLPYG